MPELPEVETVRRGLQPAMQDQKIICAEVNRPDLRWPFPPDMAQRLTGARVLRLWRRSKYILLDLDTQETLIVHLGMSGRMLVSGQQIGEFYQEHPAPEKHDHVVFHMENDTRVTFNDARRFGAMDLAPTAEVETHKMLASLGPEPLSNHLDDLIWPQHSRGAIRRLRRHFWTSDSSRVWAIFMSAKCSFGPKFRPCVRPRTCPKCRWVLWCQSFGRFWKRRLKPVALVLRIIVKQGESWVIFNTVSTFTTENPSPASMRDAAA